MARKKSETNEATENREVTEETAKELAAEAAEKMEELACESVSNESLEDLKRRLQKDLAKVGIELCKHTLEYYAPVNEDTRESVRTAVMICEMLEKTSV